MIVLSVKNNFPWKQRTQKNRSSSLFLAIIHFICHVFFRGLNQVVPAPYAVMHLSLSLIITHVHLDQILMVVVVVAHTALTLVPMRVGAAGLTLEVYSIPFLVGLAITTATMTALGLDSAAVRVDPIPIQCHRRHREGIGRARVLTIVTCLGLGQRTSISSGRCIGKKSKDM